MKTCRRRAAAASKKLVKRRKAPTRKAPTRKTPRRKTPRRKAQTMKTRKTPRRKAQTMKTRKSRRRQHLTFGGQHSFNEESGYFIGTVTKEIDLLKEINLTNEGVSLTPFKKYVKARLEHFVLNEYIFEKNNEPNKLDRLPSTPIEYELQFTTENKLLVVVTIKTSEKRFFDAFEEGLDHLQFANVITAVLPLTEVQLQKYSNLDLQEYLQKYFLDHINEKNIVVGDDQIFILDRLPSDLKFFVVLDKNVLTIIIESNAFGQHPTMNRVFTQELPNLINKAFGQDERSVLSPTISVVSDDSAASAEPNALAEPNASAEQNFLKKISIKNADLVNNIIADPKFFERVNLQANFCGKTFSDFLAELLKFIEFRKNTPIHDVNEFLTNTCENTRKPKRVNFLEYQHPPQELLHNEQKKSILELLKSLSPSLKKELEGNTDYLFYLIELKARYCKKSFEDFIPILTRFLTNQSKPKIIKLQDLIVFLNRIDPNAGCS